MDQYIQLIGSVGFPIVMCLFLVHYMQTEQKEMQSTIQGLREAIIELCDNLKFYERREGEGV